MVRVLTASTTSIYVSEKAGASVSLSVDAKAKAEVAMLTKAKGSIDLVRSRGVGVKITAKGPLTPLFELAFLRRRFFDDPSIELRSLDVSDDNDLERYDIDEEYALALIKPSLPSDT